MSAVRRPAWGPRGVDAGLLALTVGSAAFLQPATDGSAAAWGVLAGFEAVAAVALLQRRRRPVAVFLVVTAALIAAAAGAAVLGAKLSPLTVLSLAVALYAVGSGGISWPATVRAGLGGVAIVGAGVVVNHLVDVPAGYHGGTDVLAVLAPLPLAWAVGFAARTHRDDLGTSRRQLADVLQQQQWREQRAADRERTRIAREMHDVVAHSLTLLVVRAEALRAGSAELPDWAREQVDGLSVAARQAGGELRDLVRVLRSPDDDDAPRRPVPGLGDVPDLLERARGAGTVVAARLDAGTDELPRSVQLAVYRVVQESLTNARRHAPGAPVRVDLTAPAGSLRLEVRNGAAVTAVDGSWGAGLGLVSMRERVDALGGRLQVGATADGGFHVVATLPVARDDGGGRA